MSTLDSLQVVLVAGEVFAVATLAMAIAWLGAGKQAASRRHLAWAAAFAGLLALPLLMLLSPSLVHITLAAPEPVVVPQDFAAMPPMAQESSAFDFDTATIAKALLWVWLAGAGLVLARAGFAVIALARLKAQSVPHRFGHLAIDGPACELRIATVDNRCGPVTWGLFKPIVLLPKDATAWPRDRLDAVLRHELAHVARRDSLTQALAMIVCALYWPNPLVWFGARRLRREAEMAADDAALLSGIRPSTYASALLRIANDFNSRDVSHVPLAMAAPSALEARVQSVLAAAHARTGVTAKDVARIGAIAVVVAAAVAVARPSFAEAKAKPAPTRDLQVAALNASHARATASAHVMNASMRSMTSADASSDSDSEASSDADASSDQNDGDWQWAEAPTPPVPPTPVVAPEALPALPATPATPATPVTPQALRGGEVYRYDVVDDNGRRVHVYRSKLTPEDRRKIDAAMRQAQESLRAVQPQIERAMRDAHVAERVNDALRAEQPRIQAALAEAQRHAQDAQRRAQAEVQRAMARMQVAMDARRKVHADVAQALDRVAEAMDRAAEQAHARADAAHAAEDEASDRADTQE
jgi:beta-lactamase regulating signal transducer with metallopeptidase domain